MTTWQSLLEEKAHLEKLIRNYEVEVSDEVYADLLNSIYGKVSICGMDFNAGDALLELDPTAFRCGKLDYADTLDKEEDEDYQALLDELAEVEEELAAEVAHV